MDTPVAINAFGNTKDRASVDIVPQVSGVLVKTLIQDGAVVTNGQPLFLIDPSDYAARVRQAEGLVAADKANLNLSRLTLERNRSLLEKELISAESFDTLKTRVEAASAQLSADEATLEQLRAAGCDAVQGFLLSRPLAADDVPLWVRESVWARSAREKTSLRRVR
jgi:multidrug resistance efflux pump